MYVISEQIRHLQCKILTHVNVVYMSYFIALFQLFNIIPAILLFYNVCAQHHY